jgi:CubicO group peptidase (beta-lactamase class C family)
MISTQTWIPACAGRCLLVFLIIVNYIPLAFASATVGDNLPVTQGEKMRVERLGREFEDLRTLLMIPGMSAAIVKDQKLIWTSGFGYADRANSTSATPDTLYPIASLTKTFASTLLMQLSEQGKVHLDDPMRKYLDAEAMMEYFGKADEREITIRHVLTHTSEGSPGNDFNYSGFRFGALTAVIEKASNRSFRELIIENILNRAEMFDTVSARTAPNRLARPYKVYGDRVLPSDYPSNKLNAAAGLISSVIDLARYDIAIDHHLFLKEATQAASWTAAVSRQGKTLPYGLGWFIQRYQGLKFIYHYGWWPNQFSSLLLKVPEKNLTLILLANSDALSAPFAFNGVGEGDAMVSPFVSAFIKAFVLEDVYGQSLPTPRWSLNPRQFAAEISDFGNKGIKYQYEAELQAHARVLKWLEFKRQQARAATKVDEKILDAYEGEYLLRPGLSLHVVKDGAELMMLARGVGEFELVAKSITQFFVRTDEFQVTFVQNGRGQTTHLIVHRIGQDLQATKIK